MSLFRDEKGDVSAARVYLAAWLVVIAVAAWVHPAEAFWGVAVSVALGLISWAAGARIAQYIAPSIGEAGKTLVNLLKKDKPAEAKKEEGEDA